MVKAGFTPTAQKVNEAFPLPDEVQVARNRLVASLAADKADQQRELRALACTALASPGSVRQPAEIRSKVSDTSCFATQDAALEEWIGIQRVASMLIEAPLVPLAPLPAGVGEPPSPFRAPSHFEGWKQAVLKNPRVVPRASSNALSYVGRIFVWLRRDFALVARVVAMSACGGDVRRRVSPPICTRLQVLRGAAQPLRSRKRWHADREFVG